MPSSTPKKQGLHVRYFSPLSWGRTPCRSGLVNSCQFAECLLGFVGLVSSPVMLSNLPGIVSVGFRVILEGRVLVKAMEWVM